MPKTRINTGRNGVACKASAGPALSWRYSRPRFGVPAARGRSLAAPGGRSPAGPLGASVSATTKPPAAACCTIFALVALAVAVCGADFGPARRSGRKRGSYSLSDARSPDWATQESRRGPFGDSRAVLVRNRLTMRRAASGRSGMPLPLSIVPFTLLPWPRRACRGRAAPRRENRRHPRYPPGGAARLQYTSRSEMSD